MYDDQIIWLFNPMDQMYDDQMFDSSIQFETSMSNSYNHVTHDVDIFPIDRIFPCDGISVTAAQENMFGSETSNLSSSTVRLKCQY